MKILDKVYSADNQAVKYIQQTMDGYICESMYVDDGRKFVICFASQLGCAVGCKMCYNSQAKFYRNLEKPEIIKQCANIVDSEKLQGKDKKILFSCMGVGEPLLNYNNVIGAMLELDALYPHNRFAMATTGIRPTLVAKIADDFVGLDNFKLTLSLHGSNDSLRRSIIPVHESLETLRGAVEKYKNISKHDYEWNYVLLSGVNDSEDNALELVKFLREGEKIKFSTFNEFEGCCLKPSENTDKFISILEEKGVECERFTPNGRDINGACGQMAVRFFEI